MNLDDKYSISSDKLQLILRRKEIAKSGKKEGEEVYYDEGYYGKLDTLLRKFVHLQLNDEFPDDIQEMIELLKTIDDRIKDIGEKVNHELWNKKMKGEDK